MTNQKPTLRKRVRRWWRVLTANPPIVVKIKRETRHPVVSERRTPIFPRPPGVRPAPAPPPPCQHPWWRRIFKNSLYVGQQCVHCGLMRRNECDDCWHDKHIVFRLPHPDCGACNDA